MEKPNRENYYKDLEYFDKSSGKYFDNYLYIHDLEKYIKHLENKVNNVVSDDVIKCDCEDINYALVEITENLCLECNKPIK